MPGCTLRATGGVRSCPGSRTPLGRLRAPDVLYVWLDPILVLGLVIATEPYSRSPALLQVKEETFNVRIEVARRQRDVGPKVRLHMAGF